MNPGGGVVNPGGGLVNPGGGVVNPGAYVTALADLPGMGPSTLCRLLGARRPAEAWGEVLDGRVAQPSPGGRDRRPDWSRVAGCADVGARWDQLVAAGIQVTWPGETQYPAALAEGPSPPGVLFWRGRLECLSAPAVALVGTRRATTAGRRVAFELGRDLAGAGVCVVSGLALGIDGVAHRGALSSAGAGPVGVAASGVDRPYPSQHRDLWAEVVAAGAVISETSPGRPAQAWRFPARNRIIAGLVAMVVVVESHTTGGSLVTAEAALARGVEVRAVPGPVASPASAGTNQLLFDGAGPVRDAGDVLDALGMAPPRPSGRARETTLFPADPQDREVLDAVGWSPTSLNQVVLGCGLSLREVNRGLDRLEQSGLVEGRGGWWARTGSAGG